MMRRSVIDKGYYYDESLNMSEDLDLWLRLMNDGNKVANVPDIVLNYRVTENFPAKRSDQTQREYMKLVRKKTFVVSICCIRYYPILLVGFFCIFRQKLSVRFITKKILFMKESTEGVAEGQTTAEAGKPEIEESVGQESERKTV